MRAPRWRPQVVSGKARAWVVACHDPGSQRRRAPMANCSRAAQPEGTSAVLRRSSVVALSRSPLRHVRHASFCRKTALGADSHGTATGPKVAPHVRRGTRYSRRGEASHSHARLEFGGIRMPLKQSMPARHIPACSAAHGTSFAACDAAGRSDRAIRPPMYPRARRTHTAARLRARPALPATGRHGTASASARRSNRSPRHRRSSSPATIDR